MRRTPETTSNWQLHLFPRLRVARLSCHDVVGHGHTMDRYSADAALIRLLNSQYGYGRVDQLYELGLSPDQIRLRVRRKLLQRVARGVVASPSPDRSLAGRAMRAVMLGGEGSVTSLWTAAELHGLDAPRSDQIHVVVEGRARRSADATVYIHRTRYLPPAHIADVDGLPVTSVPRTIVDCSSLLDRWHAVRLLDSCAADRSMWRTIHNTARDLSNGRAGVRTIADVTAPDGAARMRSVLERRADEALRSRGAPQGEWNVVIYDDRGRVREVDLCYRQQRLIVEFDGLRYHRTTMRQRRDRATDRRLQLAGWSVLRFTWRDVVHEPAQMVHDIMRALEAR